MVSIVIPKLSWNIMERKNKGLEKGDPPQANTMGLRDSSARLTSGNRRPLVLLLGRLKASYRKLLLNSSVEASVRSKEAAHFVIR